MREGRVCGESGDNWAESQEPLAPLTWAADLDSSGVILRPAPSPGQEGL